MCKQNVHTVPKKNRISLHAISSTNIEAYSRQRDLRKKMQYSQDARRRWKTTKDDRDDHDLDQKKEKNIITSITRAKKTWNSAHTCSIFSIYSVNYKNVRKTFEAVRMFYLQKVPRTIPKTKFSGALTLIKRPQSMESSMRKNK